MLNLIPQSSDLNSFSESYFMVQSSSESVSVKSIPATPEKVHSREDLSVFFGIGMTINIVMIIVFVIWGIKQWKKHDASKK